MRTFFLRLAPPRSLAIPAYLATLVAWARAQPSSCSSTTGYGFESPWAVATLCGDRGGRRTRPRSTEQHDRTLDFAASDALRGSRLRPARGDDCRSRFDARWLSLSIYEVGGLHIERSAHGSRNGARGRVGCFAGGWKCRDRLCSDGGRRLRRAAARHIFRVDDAVPPRNRTVRDYAQTLLPVVVASVPLYTPVVAVLVIAYQDVSPWTLPLFLTPALAAQRLFAMYQEQRRLAEDLSTANEALEEANLSFRRSTRCDS